MTIRLIETLEDLLPFRAAWNRLVERSPNGTVFQTFEWLQAWWQAFGTAYRLQVLLVLDGGLLVAAAPLMASEVRAFGRSLRCLEFLGGRQTDYKDFLYNDGDGLDRLLHALGSDIEWGLFDLHGIPASSPTAPALPRGLARWRGTLSTSDVCPAYVFDAHHDGADILRKESVRRHLRGLAKSGVVGVHHLTEAADVEPQLDTFFRQHIERRSVTNAVSKFRDPRSRKFHRLLTASLASQGWLLFTVLALDGNAVAYHFGFVYRQRLVWYTPSFAPSLARFSPGEVLLAELFKYCQAQTLSELDFTIGNEPFKSRFCTVKRHNVRFRAFRNPLLQALEQGQHRLIARVKQVKGLEAFARIVLGAVSLITGA